MSARAIIALALCCGIDSADASAWSNLRKVSQVTFLESSTEMQQIQSLHNGRPKRKLMDMINKFRAEVCAKMKDEHGRDFDTFEDCKKFMKKACNPGKDGVMDGDGKEVTSGEGFCKEYFHEQKAEKELKDIEEKEKAAPAAPPVVPAPAPAPAPAPQEPVATTTLSPAPVPAPAETPKQEAAAPAPVPAAPAGPAAPAAPLPGDEAWYYKEGGKWSGRLHMKADWKLPTQGYWGKLVEHEDKKTMTEDWGAEFNADHRTYAEICKEHPDNQWCRQNGYHKRNSGFRMIISPAAMTVTFLLCVLGA